MKFCAGCGNRSEDAARFCVTCGQPFGGPDDRTIISGPSSPSSLHLLGAAVWALWTAGNLWVVAAAAVARNPLRLALPILMLAVSVPLLASAWLQIGRAYILGHSPQIARKRLSAFRLTTVLVLLAMLLPAGLHVLGNLAGAPEPKPRKQISAPSELLDLPASPLPVK